MDSRIRQTFTASPAEPGGLLAALDGDFDLPDFCLSDALTDRCQILPNGNPNVLQCLLLRLAL